MIARESEPGHPLAIVVRDATEMGGGVTNVARPIHLALLSQGWEGAFISGRGPEDSELGEFIVGWNGCGFRELPSFLMRSLVHIHGIWTPFEFQAFREARRRRAIIVMSPHGALEPWAFDHKLIKKRLAWWSYQKRILQLADLLIVNSEQERARLRELGLKPPIATIPNGVDLRGFDAKGCSAQRERVVLFLSRLDPKKGVPDLIDAWRGLTDRRGHCLHIIGHGDANYVKLIKEKIDESGCNDIVLLPPAFGSDRWEFFSRASIYVLPSYSENFGITVAEALTAGLPVITTRATPWAHLVNEGLGWIIDNDVSQLRQAIEHAIRLEPAELESMRLKAHTYAFNNFSWETISERYIETYEWILQRSGPAPAYIDQG